MTLEAKDPFTIRAHHLSSYQKLVRGDLLNKLLKPDELIRKLTYTASGYRKLRGSDKVSIGLSWYGKDVIGEAEEEEHTYRVGMKGAFERFLTLDIDDPVDIILGKDEICRACVHGEHCRRIDQLPGVTSNSLVSDNGYLDAFLDFVKKRPDCPEIVTGPIEVTNEELTFEDAGVLTVRRVRTNFGTVRNFLIIMEPWEIEAFLSHS